MDLFDSGKRQVESCCEYGDEPLGATKYCETIEWQHNSSSTQIRRVSMRWRDIPLGSWLGHYDRRPEGQGFSPGRVNWNFQFT
jgi:hypothetical protein